MKRWVQYLGILGLVFIAFGLLTWGLMLDEANRVSQIHLVLGVCALLVFFIGGGVQMLKGVAMRRAAGYGIGVTLYSALFIGILVVANLYVVRNDPLHFDSTEEKVFTLAPQTQKVLSQLENPVHLRGFFVGGEVDTETRALFERLARFSTQFSWEIIDPEKDPRATERFGISERDTLHFSFADESSEREVKVVRDLSEQAIINAILKLTRGGEKKVYWISGHGQSDLDSDSEAGFVFLKESIQGENIKVEKLLLTGGKTIPENADAVLLMAPRRALLEEEKQAVDRYLADGGNMLLLSEPNTTRDVAEIVAPLGIEVGDDIVLDQVIQLFSGPSIGVQPVISSYGAHPAMQDFTQNVIMSTVSSVRIVAKPLTGHLTELAFTGENSWPESDVAAIFSENPTIELPDDSLRGAVPIAVAYQGHDKEVESPKQAQDVASDNVTPPTNDEKETSESEQEAEDESAEAEKSGGDAQYAGKVVVIGDSDFVANVNIRQLFNRDFFLNTLNWVVGEDQRISIRERSLRSSTETLNPEQFQQIFLVSGVLLPELVLLWGLTVWWKRRA